MCRSNTVAAMLRLFWLPWSHRCSWIQQCVFTWLLIGARSDCTWCNSTQVNPETCQTFSRYKTKDKRSSTSINVQMYKCVFCIRTTIWNSHSFKTSNYYSWSRSLLPDAYLQSTSQHLLLLNTRADVIIITAVLRSTATQLLFRQSVSRCHCFNSVRTTFL